MGLFNCTCRYKFAQPELTLNDLKFEKDSKTEAVTKILCAYKCYQARKLVKFILKRKKSIADGIEIKMGWDCTNKLKIPDGFEYTQQNLAYLKKEILNFYNILFDIEIKSNTKISIKKENLLYVTKENFLEKFKTLIMFEMFKNFDLGSKNNEMARVTVEDSFNEKLLTLKYKGYARIHTVTFVWDKESKSHILKKSTLDDEISRNEEKIYASYNSNIDDSNSIANDREANKISLTSAVKKIFSMAKIHKSTDKEKEKITELAKENEDKGNRNHVANKGSLTPSKETTNIKKKVNFKSEIFKKHRKEQSKTTNNSTPERVKYMDKKQKDKIDSDNEFTSNYFSFYANSKSTMRNTNTKIYEENNLPSIEGILNDILSHTDTGEFLTFLDIEDGTFYEGTIHGYYDKQGLGIELLFDKSKGLRYKYLGYFYKNHFHGYGIIAYENGLFYKGEFRMGQRTGYGFEMSKTSIYRGFFNNGKYCGYGELKADNEFYIGTFQNGLKEGFGLTEHQEGNSNSIRYIGGFRNNLMDGVGLLMLPGDKYYYGEFRDNLMNGRGEYKWSSGDIYVGGYLDNLKHGEGEYYLKSSHAILKGSWCNGEKINEFKLYQINENNI